jgi:hypothetical protein
VEGRRGGSGREWGERERGEKDGRRGGREGGGASDQLASHKDITIIIIYHIIIYYYYHLVVLLLYGIGRCSIAHDFEKNHFNVTHSSSCAAAAHYSQ